jgi:hypothetical protein
MNFFSCSCRCFSVGISAVCLSTLAVRGQSITITPSAVSNTYSNALTLNVTSLTNGEQVTIQHFLDLNGNSAVDPGEPMIDAFKITDGGASVIGGVTNLNVPFDSTSATGAITTTLSFAPSLENIVGQHIYRLASPTHRFTAVDTTFNVTNAALAQAVTGTVFATSTPQPNAIVVALHQPDNNYNAGAVADSNGNYFLKLSPGTYSLFAVGTNSYFDGGIAPQVTLTNGMTTTNNLFVTNAVVTISGQVYDAGNSNTLGGVELQLSQSSGNLVAYAFTDTNGNYNAGVTSNNWKIKLSGQRMARRAYVVPQTTALSVNATLGSVTNANIALTKGNALFYGRITDAPNNPFANIDIGVNNAPAQFKASGYSDTNGNYSVAIWGGTNAWFSFPNNDNYYLLSNYVISAPPSATLATNQAALQNFIVLPITATISGRLVNNLGSPVYPVGVGAGMTTSNGTSFATLKYDTDTNGNFTVGVANGAWIVSAAPVGNHGLETVGYYEPDFPAVSVPPDATGITIIVYPTNLFFLNQAERISSTQFGMNLNASSGNNYTILATTNLSLPSSNWFNVLVISNLVGNSYFIQDNQATNSQRFYRALLGP